MLQYPLMILLISPDPNFSAPRPQSLHQGHLWGLEVQPQHEQKVNEIVLFLKLCGNVSPDQSAPVFQMTSANLFSCNWINPC